MSIAKKLITVAENMSKVYEAGKNYIWEVVQQGGARNEYAYAFAYWDIDYIHPKYKVAPTHTHSLNQTFTKCKAIKIEKEYFDFSQKLFANGSNSGCYYTFSTCSNLEEIEDIKIPVVPNYTHAFAWCGQLHTIGFPLKCTETTTWNSTFFSTKNLQNLIIDGVIGTDQFNVSYCTKLTKDSILSILKALSLDITATTTITFSTTHQSIIETDTDCQPYWEAAKNAGWSFVYA